VGEAALHLHHHPVVGGFLRYVLGVQEHLAAHMREDDPFGAEVPDVLDDAGS